MLVRDAVTDCDVLCVEDRVKDAVNDTVGVGGKDLLADNEVVADTDKDAEIESVAEMLSVRDSDAEID